MNKDENVEMRVDTGTAEVRHGVNLGDVLQAYINDKLDTHSLLTRILENNLSALESLRASIERAQRKSIEDVRDFGDTMASAMFVGVEEPIDYEDLLTLIEEMKDGLAARRLHFNRF